MRRKLELLVLQIDNRILWIDSMINYEDQFIKYGATSDNLYAKKEELQTLSRELYRILNSERKKEE